MVASHIWIQDNGDPHPTWRLKFIWKLNRNCFLVSTIDSHRYFRFCITHSPEPFVSSTTLLASELCLSSLGTAPFVAQLQRICLLPSHFPAKLGHSFVWCLHITNASKIWRHVYWTETIYTEENIEAVFSN